MEKAAALGLVGVFGGLMALALQIKLTAALVAPAIIVESALIAWDNVEQPKVTENWAYPDDVGLRVACGFHSHWFDLGARLIGHFLEITHHGATRPPVWKSQRLLLQLRIATRSY